MVEKESKKHHCRLELSKRDGLCNSTYRVVCPHYQVSRIHKQDALKDDSLTNTGKSTLHSSTGSILSVKGPEYY